MKQLKLNLLIGVVLQSFPLVIVVIILIRQGLEFQHLTAKWIWETRSFIDNIASQE